MLPKLSRMSMAKTSLWRLLSCRWMVSNFRARYILLWMKALITTVSYGEKDGTTKEYHHDIAFDELGDVLDSMIETGSMTKEKYQAKVKDFVCSL